MGRALTAALIAVLVVGVGAVLYVIAASVAKPGAQAGLAGLNRGTMAKLQVLADPVPAAQVMFVNADFKPVHLSDFHGHPVVLNLWATWCAPCVKEMPTLAALQGADQGLKVVAVSMDTASETDKAKAFMVAHPPLAFYQDAKYGFMTGLKPQLLGFPTTVLIDRSGLERAVYSGDADWNSPDAKAVVARLASL